MRMQCPLCKKRMMLIGSDEVGWDCETKEYIKGIYMDKWSGELLDGATSHYSVRGARATITIFPFQIETWQVPEEYPGVSTVYHWIEEKRKFEKVFSCPAISVEDKDKLLERLKLLTLFS